MTKKSVWLFSINGNSVRFRITPKHIHLRLQTLPQHQIIRPQLIPAYRLLVEVQPSADLDHPAVIQAHLAVVQVRVEVELKDHVGFQQALLQVAQLLLDLGLLGLIFVARDQVDALDVGELDHPLAQADEVLDLVRQADEGVFDLDALGAGQVGAKDGLVAVAGIVVEDGEVFFLRAFRFRRRGRDRRGGQRRGFGRGKRGQGDWQSPWLRGRRLCNRR